MALSFVLCPGVGSIRPSQLWYLCSTDTWVANRGQMLIGDGTPIVDGRGHRLVSEPAAWARGPGGGSWDKCGSVPSVEPEWSRWAPLRPTKLARKRHATKGKREFQPIVPAAAGVVPRPPVACPQICDSLRRCHTSLFPGVASIGISHLSFLIVQTQQQQLHRLSDTGRVYRPWLVEDACPCGSSQHMSTSSSPLHFLFNRYRHSPAHAKC